MENKAVGKLKPSNHEFILGIAWKNTKTSLFCGIKWVYHFLLFHHFLGINYKKSWMYRGGNFYDSQRKFKTRNLIFFIFLHHFKKSIWEARQSCVTYLWPEVHRKIHEDCISLSNSKIMHHDRLWYSNWNWVMHNAIFRDHSVCEIRWRMRIAECKHFAYRESPWQFIMSTEIVTCFSREKWRLTRNRVNFRVSSEGVGQSLVIIYHAKSLQVSIFQNFDDIYRPKESGFDFKETKHNSSHLAYLINQNLKQGRGWRETLPT